MYILENFKKYNIFLSNFPFYFPGNQKWFYDCALCDLKVKKMTPKDRHLLWGQSVNEVHMQYRCKTWRVIYLFIFMRTKPKKSVTVHYLLRKESPDRFSSLQLSIVFGLASVVGEDEFQNKHHPFDDTWWCVSIWSKHAK